MRMLAMAAMSLGGALLVIPMMILGNPNASAVPNANPAEQSEETRKFRAYLDADWKRWMEEYPDVATQVGYPGQDARWTDDSPAGIERRKKHLAESIGQLKQIHRDALPDGEKLNFDLYSQLLETSEEGLKYGDDPLPFRFVVPRSLWMPMNQMEGIQQGAADALESTPHHRVAEYEIILERMKALSASVDQQIDLLKEGLKRGYTPPKITMRDVPKQIADLIPTDPMASALLQPFTEFPTAFSDADKSRLTDQAKKIYTSSLAPAFQRLHDYVATTYVPACRDNIAAISLSNGAAAYAFHVHWQTTTDLTPAQIHEIGLSEVKRIRAEMDKIIASVNFKGGFHDFTEFLRTDPRFYYDKPEDLVNAYRVIAKRIDPELAHEFGKLPRLPYGVCEIPAFQSAVANDRLLPRWFAGSRPTWLLLREHLQSPRAAEVGDGSAITARSCARASFADFARAGDGRRAGIPEACRVFGVRRRLGAVLGKPRRRTRIAERPVFEIRAAHV